MTRYRPTGVLVIAILHLVFGGLGLVSDLCGLAMQLGGQRALMQAMAGPQAVQQLDTQASMMEERIPGYHLINTAEMVMLLVLDLMMLCAGIGLLSMRPWARGLSIGYGILSIGNRIAVTLFTVIFVMPVMRQLMDEMMTQQGLANPMAGFMSTMMSMGLFASIVVMFIYLVYPITVLVIMFHPITTAAFNGQGPTAEDEMEWDRPYPEATGERFERGEPDERYRPRDH